MLHMPDFQLVGPCHIENYLFDQVLCESHHLIVVAIGAVKLAGRKLWVVCLVDALVSEVLADLEHL